MITSQLRYHIGGGTLPGNCDNVNYYKSAGPSGGLCHPDEVCSKFKVNNPISYPFKLYLSRQKDKEDKEFVEKARGEIFKCNKCDKAYPTEKSLNMHYGRAHGMSEY
ncbi:hypothetical protein CL614_04480 [archaeon]|nr:hypothetical protein [archaeon]